MTDTTDQKIAEALGWEKLQRASPTDPQWWAKGSLRACILPSLLTDKALQIDALVWLYAKDWALYRSVHPEWFFLRKGNCVTDNDAPLGHALRAAMVQELGL